MHFDHDRHTRGRLGTALAATVVAAVAIATLVQRAARRARTRVDEPGTQPAPASSRAHASVPPQVVRTEQESGWTPTPLADPLAYRGAGAPPIWEPTRGNVAAQVSHFGEWSADDLDADLAPESGVHAEPGIRSRRPASMNRFATWSSAVVLLGLALLGGVAVNGATADDVADPLSAPVAPLDLPQTPPPVEDPATTPEPPVADEPVADEPAPVVPPVTEPVATEPVVVADPPPVTPPPVTQDDVAPDEDEVCDPDQVVDEDELDQHETCTPVEDATGAGAGAGASGQASAEGGQSAAGAVVSSDAAVAAPAPAAPVTDAVVDEAEESRRGAIAHIPIFDLETAPSSNAGATSTGSHRSKKPGDAATLAGSPTANAPGLPGRSWSSAPVEAPPAAAILSSPLMPTPEQIRLYVRAAKTDPLPRLKTINHQLAGRFTAAGRRYHVGWTLLAAIAREESNYGKDRRNGLLGERLSDADFTRYARHAGRAGAITRSDPADALAAVAAYLSVHGASRDALAPGKSTAALTAYLGSRDAADRVTANAAFIGALGTHGLQHGLAASSKRLRLRVTNDKRVELYEGGRRDVQQGRIDTRVLLVAEYLANSFGQVRLSSLVSGHRLFSTSGNVSAHVYGRAVDVAEVGHTSIYGHQAPGSVTERAVKLLLMLPGKVQPRQVISLLDLDGPTGNRGSFSLADHDDHIHVGY